MGVPPIVMVARLRALVREGFVRIGLGGRVRKWPGRLRKPAGSGGGGPAGALGVGGGVPPGPSR